MKERRESLHLFPSDECLQQMRSCRHRVEKCLGPHILHRDSDKLKAMYSSKKSSDIYNKIQVRKCSRNGRLLTRKFRSSKNRGKRKKNKTSWVFQQFPTMVSQSPSPINDKYRCRSLHSNNTADDGHDLNDADRWLYPLFHLQIRKLNVNKLVPTFQQSLRTQPALKRPRFVHNATDI